MMRKDLAYKAMKKRPKKAMQKKKIQTSFLAAGEVGVSDSQAHP